MIELRNVWAEFGRLKALKGVSLEIKPREYIVLLGPSGAGKTTLLRTIAGLIKQSEGEIYLGIGKDGEKVNVSVIPPENRNVAFLPQTYALFPQMTVWENTVFGPVVKFWSDEQIKVIGWEILEMVRLDGRTDAYPDELSGGMQQRCALARALAASSKILLLDEPLRALDARLRIELREELRRLSNQLDMTTIHVTHDQEEAVNIADRIVVMNKGKIEQVGTPEDIYNRPASPFVANFVGEANFLPGIVVSASGSEITVEITGDNGSVRVIATGFSLNDTVVIAIKPEKLKLVEKVDKGNSNIFTGRVINKYFLGRYTAIKVELEGIERQIKIKHTAHEDTGLENNSPVHFTFSPENCVVFHHDGSKIDKHFAEE